MSDPTRYAWCPHGMRPSTVEFGTIRYINQHDHDRLVAVLRRERDKARALVAAQAEDAGLWFVAMTASEAYLQQELRRLHSVIEGDTP